MTLPQVQALRGLAAGLVVIDHALTFAVGHGLPAEPTTRIAWALGDLGVAVFFVISGFIMVVATPESVGLADASAFLRRRAIRVIPLYWICTAAAIALIGLGVWRSASPASVETIVKSALFIPYQDATGWPRPILGPGWTLNYEAFFYLLFAVSLLAPRRVGLFALIGLLCALSVAGVLLAPTDPVLRFYTAPWLLLFAAGVGLGAVHLRRPIRWLRSSAPSFVLAVGDASYSLYLTHFFVLLVVAKLWTVAGSPMAPAFVVFAVASTIPPALLCHRILERPLLAWLRALTENTVPKVDAAARGAVEVKDAIASRSVDEQLYFRGRAADGH